MLSIGFSELLIIGTVGLIVIGPKRLPETARFLGHLFGRLQRQIASVKADIRREMAVEDMKSIHREYEEAAEKMRGAFDQAASSMRQTAGEAEKTIQEATQPETAPTPPPAAEASAALPAATEKPDAAAKDG